MIEKQIEKDRVVRSKAGRDKGRFLVVYSYDGGEYCQIVDGKTRTIASPKRKKLMHLEVTNTKLALFSRENEREVCDADVRKALKAAGFLQPQKDEEGYLGKERCD